MNRKPNKNPGGKQKNHPGKKVQGSIDESS
jgi:hypothetical protein